MLSHDALTLDLRPEPHQIAGAGLLESLTFDQGHIIDPLRKDIKNLNVLSLAALLGALPCMDIYHYSFTQEELAFKMYLRNNMKRIPSRQAVAKWEGILAENGLVDIPVKPGAGQYKTKVRTLTPKFIRLARRFIVKKPYHICLPATEVNQPFDEGSGSDPDRKEIRADERETIEKGHGRASLAPKGIDPELKKAAIQSAPLRPPQFTGTRGKKLPKFENSVLHWLYQNWNVEGAADAALLFAVLLDNPDDEYICQLRRQWSTENGPRDTERPGLVSGLVEHLRRLRGREAVNRTTEQDNVGVLASTNTRRDTSPDITPVLETPQREKFRAALFGFGEYSGPGADIVERFRAADADEQEKILTSFQGGELLL